MPLATPRTRSACRPCFTPTTAKASPCMPVRDRPCTPSPTKAARCAFGRLKRRSRRWRAIPQPDMLESNNQLYPDPLSQSGSGAGQRCQGQAGISGIEQPIQRRTAGMHLGGHGRLGKLLCFHFLLNLPGNDPLHSRRRRVFQYSFLGQKIVETTAAVFVFHHLPSWTCFSRFFASARSSTGVLLDFLMNPWSSTMVFPLTVNKTRAIRV